MTLGTFVVLCGLSYATPLYYENTTNPVLAEKWRSMINGWDRGSPLHFSSLLARM